MSFEGAGDPFSELESLIAELRGELNSKLQRLQDLLQREEVRKPVAAEPAVTEGVNLAYVNAAFQRIAMAKTQEEILENYLRESQGVMDRAILFLNKDAQYVPWKSLGFAAGSIEAISAGDPNDPIVRAAEQKRLIYRSDGVELVFPWLRNAGDLPRNCVCVPLIFEDFVPIVLYGDSSRPIPIDTVELLTHLGVLTLKNNYLQSLLGEATVVLPPLEAARPPRVEPQPVPPPLTPPAPTLEEQEPEPEPAPETFLEEPAAAGPDLSFAETIPQTPEPTLDFETEVSAEEQEEFEMAHGEVDAGMEALRWTAPAEARAEELRPPEPAAAAPQPAVPMPEPSRELTAEPTLIRRSEEEERYHSEARRFARLLVSEIKLYNEEEVINGRQQGDLYRRLSSDIDRSREMYEKRVHSPVASGVDYFHEEMVRILAKGNETLLGEDYPGPVLRTSA